MTFYIGVDFHPHQQTLCWCDEQTGETQTLDMDHDLKKVFLVKLTIKVRDNITAEEFDLRGKHSWHCS